MISKYGTVLHLFSKKTHGSTMVELKTLSLKAGHGIEGDINANFLSPRQVLVVRYEEIVELAIQPSDLRENIVIVNIPSRKFIPGSLITFESGAAIRLTFYCEPCKQVAHLVESLKTIQRKRGILGVVITPGKIQVGSLVKIETHKFPALSENPYQRFLNFVKKIPQGKVVTYKEIIMGIGVDNSYLRAIPTYLKKTDSTDYPIHRILDSKGNLITYVLEQKKQLESEGIKVLCEPGLNNNLDRYFVNSQEYLYIDETIYLS